MNTPLEDRKELLAAIPAAGILIQHPALQALCQQHPASYVHNCVRRELDFLRHNILDADDNSRPVIPPEDEIITNIQERVVLGLGNHPMRAVNAAGVILHTGLGRAPLAPAAQAALMETAARYCLLASDRNTGKRGDRNIHNEELLQELTGAESAVIVNNNAAAVMLALNTFGQNRESVISRGELVEIGGMFRIPDVMRRAGTVMVEVGTTNKTHLSDYQNALSERTALIVKVHSSNYRIEGFHKEVPIRELAELSRQQNLVLLHDIGSGALVDLRRWNLPDEPTVPEAVAEGADIVTFSGDKLLGGPQCGVIVGKTELIGRMKRNPLMRAIRVDKLILSALNGTLRLFLEPDRLPSTHPVYRMLTETLPSVRNRARRLARSLSNIGSSYCRIDVIDGETEVGSGALPARTIPTYLTRLTPHSASAEQLGRALRRAIPPVFSRIEADAVLLDARTIADDELITVAKAYEQAMMRLSSPRASSIPPII